MPLLLATDLTKSYGNVPVLAGVTLAMEPGEKVAAGAPYEVQGLAVDSGKGIAKVEVSVDGGGSWKEAKLDKELGKYSWRRWRYDWRPARGRQRLMARATNAAGETQTTTQWNRSGYARNVIESLDVTVE